MGLEGFLVLLKWSRLTNPPTGVDDGEAVDSRTAGPATDDLFEWIAWHLSGWHGLRMSSAVAYYKSFI